MRIEIETVSVRFECEKCHEEEEVPLVDICDVGPPFCRDCEEIMVWTAVLYKPKRNREDD